MDHINGIDVSDFQGSIAWAEVRDDGYTFAFSKATEGLTVVHDTFAPNMGDIRQVGMRAGAYHFFHFDEDPVAQAQHFMSIYNAPNHLDLPPMLDLEADVPEDVDPIEAISKFLAPVEAKYGTRCLLYMGLYYWRDQLKATTDFDGHPLWIAQYSDEAEPDIPTAWSTATIWQRTEKGVLPGIDGSVDEDWFLGDMAAFNVLKVNPAR